MLIIDIDYREQKLLKLINPSDNNTIVAGDTIYGPVTYNNIQLYYKISNLPLGDFIYKNDDESSIYYIIERKSISDLAGSIKDGRFRDQKERLSETKNDIIYIIEGNIGKNGKVGGICKSTIKSSIINLQVKHKFHVFKTDSEADTLEYLLLLYKKINENGGVSDFQKIKPVTMKKKSNASSVYVNQLMMISGVSKVIADKIAEVYKSLYQLINTYNNCSVIDGENLLSNIQITNKRKLGKALSKKIHNALMLQCEAQIETELNPSTEIETEVEQETQCEIEGDTETVVVDL
jgi:crossover junction endonuclease MUS81